VHQVVAVAPGANHGLPLTRRGAPAELPRQAPPRATETARSEAPRP
jgi:hypothetical protein